MKKNKIIEEKKEQPNKKEETTKGKVSYFTGGITNIYPSGIKTIKELYALIISDAYIDLIKKVNTESDKNKRNALKKKLPYFTPNGVFTKRKNSAIESYSGLVSIDIDDLNSRDEAETTKHSLKYNKYIELMFVSPSGKGLKIFYKINICDTGKEIINYFYEIKDDLIKNFGINEKNIDENCKDISRACFISHDSEAYYNPYAETYCLKGIYERKLKKPPLSSKKTNDDIEIPFDVKRFIEHLHDVTDLYYNKKTNIADDRSKAEWNLICRLIHQGVQTKDDIYYLMKYCLIGKWQEAGDAYQKITFEKAYDFCFNESDSIPKKKKLDVSEQLDIVANTVSFDVLWENRNIYYNPKLRQVVEFSEHKDKVTKHKEFALVAVDNRRLINILSNEFYVCKTSIRDDKIEEKPKHITFSIADLLLKNDVFLNTLKQVERISSVPLFMKDSKSKYFLPHQGYNENFNLLLTDSIVKLKLYSSSKAKKIIYKLYDEFGFKNDQDRVHAIAHLLTPACRGLYDSHTDRSPVFTYLGNRPGTGKDYCAGIVSIIYNGRAIEYSPICTEKQRFSTEDELRKKLFSAALNGEKIIHFANNKGDLNNAILEQVTTSTALSDRILGKSESKTINNEFDFSLSANVGITYTSDFERRARFISLFYAGEDINKRQFKQRDLHKYVKENRDKILSAVLSLQKHWIDAGCPSETNFTSFNEWAKVVGGIMTYHEMGNPCEKYYDENVSVDFETQEMKKIWEFMFEKKPDTPLKFTQIADELELGLIEDETLCTAFTDDTKQINRPKLAKKMRTFLGREFSNIVFKLARPNTQKRREEYLFTTVSVDRIVKGEGQG